MFNFFKFANKWTSDDTVFIIGSALSDDRNKVMISPDCEKVHITYPDQEGFKCPPGWKCLRELRAGGTQPYRLDKYPFCATHVNSDVDHAGHIVTSDDWICGELLTMGEAEKYVAINRARAGLPPETEHRRNWHNGVEWDVVKAICDAEIDEFKFKRRYGGLDAYCAGITTLGQLAKLLSYWESSVNIVSSMSIANTLLARECDVLFDFYKEIHANAAWFIEYDRCKHRDMLIKIHELVVSNIECDHKDYYFGGLKRLVR